MNPEADQILSLSAGQLMATLVPLLPAGFARGSASVLGVMMLLSAQEYDRAAEIRMAENDDLRALFRDAQAQTDDAALRTALRQAASLREESLKISALNATNAELRRMLIRLQSAAEEAGNATLQRRIWAVLKAGAERRLLRLS